MHTMTSLTVTGALGWLLTLVVLAPAVDVEADELDLPALNAFAIGTDVNIASVGEKPTESFNDSLRAARERGEEWTANTITIALRFAEFPNIGGRQSVTVQTSPSEWEPGRPVKWVRVTLEEHGWLDDSVSGQRFVIWLTSDPTGELIVRRALWAQECYRKYGRYYTADPCP